MNLCLAGDVMTGRGIDQAFAQAADPALYEPYVRCALDYVELAETASGAIPRPVSPEYIWGDALAELARADLRIINLETAITSDGTPWRGKAIHYRMHPANAACLSAAHIDCCVLANNHVLDWGRPGLIETLDTLDRQGIRHAGAGRYADEALAPAIIPHGGSRLLVFGYAMEDSGVPPDWHAAAGAPGVNFLESASPAACDAIAAQIAEHRRAGDVVVVSVHWGGNWGYAVAAEHRAFAHRLIDAGAADIVHGHSSHHPRAIEIHRRRPIFYGCGDLLNDYEGIGGYDEFRPQLTLLYFADLDEASGALEHLALVPLRVRRFRLERAPAADAQWLAQRLDRESRPYQTRVQGNRHKELVVYG